MTDDVTTHARIGNSIRADILAGRLAPGDQLPSVRELAQKFSASPTTVQESIRRLKSGGIVTSIPKKGSYVRDDVDTTKFGVSLEALAEELSELRSRVARLEAGHACRVLPHGLG
jgi:DNA-binding GntR family transcriptional regulator